MRTRPRAVLAAAICLCTALARAASVKTDQIVGLPAAPRLAAGSSLSAADPRPPATSGTSAPEALASQQLRQAEGGGAQQPAEARLDLAFENRPARPETAAEPVAEPQAAQTPDSVAVSPAAEEAPQPASSQPPAPAPSARPRKASRLSRIAQAALLPLKAPFRRPSNDGDWEPDVAVLPSAEFNGEEVSIRNVRSFAYKHKGKKSERVKPGYYDKTFKLSDVDSLWFGQAPFGGLGSAHTFVSFGLKDGTYLAVSVEIRRRRGDQFSAWKGLWRGFELTYVIGDERDVIRLRTNFRREDVRLYPIKASPEGMRNLLADMLRRANALRAKPEFYHSVFKNCTTSLLSHVNRIAPKEKRLPYSYQVFFPAYSDRLLYDRGLIDTKLGFEEARQRFLITERAREHDEDAAFSQAIRQ